MSVFSEQNGDCLEGEAVQGLQVGQELEGCEKMMQVELVPVRCDTRGRTSICQGPVELCCLMGRAKPHSVFVSSFCSF